MLARGVHDECVGGAWKVHGVCMGSLGCESEGAARVAKEVPREVL